EGGLAVAAAEMAIAGGLGMDLDLARMPADTNATTALLFGESAGRFLVEVPVANTDDFEKLFAGLPFSRIGMTTPQAHLQIQQSNDLLVDIPVTDLEAAWKGYPPPLTAPTPTE